MATAFIHQGGGNWVLQILTSVLARPATLSIGLRTLNGVGSNPSDAAYADLMSNATVFAEVSGSGYARQALTFNSANFPISQNGGGDYLFTSAQVTFSFTGSVTGITHACLLDTTNAVLIASTPLAAVRNVAASDTIKDIFTFTITHN